MEKVQGAQDFIGQLQDVHADLEAIRRGRATKADPIRLERARELDEALRDYDAAIRYALSLQHTTASEIETVNEFKAAAERYLDQWKFIIIHPEYGPSNPLLHARLDTEVERISNFPKYANFTGLQMLVQAEKNIRIEEAGYAAQ